MIDFKWKLPANADHEENLGFSRLVEAAEVLGLTLAQNEVFLSRTVLFHITFGALEDLFAGDFLGLERGHNDS